MRHTIQASALEWHDTCITETNQGWQCMQDANFLAWVKCIKEASVRRRVNICAQCRPKECVAVCAKQESLACVVPVSMLQKKFPATGINNKYRK